MKRRTENILIIIIIIIAIFGYAAIYNYAHGQIISENIEILPVNQTKSIAKIYTARKYYQNLSGQWDELNLHIYNRAERTAGGYKFGVWTEKYILELPDSIGTNQFFRLRDRAGHYISYRLHGIMLYNSGTGQRQVITIDTSAIEIDSSAGATATATYYDIKNGLDYRITRTINGVKQDFLIDQAVRTKINLPVGWDSTKTYIGLLFEFDSNFNLSNLFPVDDKIDSTDLAIGNIFNLPNGHAFSLGDSQRTEIKTIKSRINEKNWLAEGIRFKQFADTAQYKGDILIDPVVRLSTANSWAGAKYSGWKGDFPAGRDTAAAASVGENYASLYYRYANLPPLRFSINRPDIKVSFDSLESGVTYSVTACSLWLNYYQAASAIGIDDDLIFVSGYNDTLDTDAYIEFHGRAAGSAHTSDSLTYYKRTSGLSNGLNAFVFRPPGCDTVTAKMNASPGSRYLVMTGLSVHHDYNNNAPASTGQDTYLEFYGSNTNPPYMTIEYELVTSETGGNTLGRAIGNITHDARGYELEAERNKGKIINEIYTNTP